MKVFKKILCPVDFSAASKKALDYASTFAETSGAQLELMHVSPNLTDAYTALMPDFPTYNLMQEDVLVEHFNEFADDWAGNLKKTVRAGTPYIEIVEYAEQGQHDLILLGAKGHSNFERLFLGSTGEKVARNSHIPVLTVHSKSGGLPIKRILVPIDFSSLSYAVLPTVATIASQFNSEIMLLHVVETGHDLPGEPQVKQYEYFEAVKERLAEEWELPEEFSKIETRKFVRHHKGSAGYGILQFAQDWDIDLIAMATHGRTGLSKVLLGSVTEKVIRIAPFPVLSIRSQISS